VIDPAVDEAITRAHREEWARVIAVLTRHFGDLTIAEDAAAEAVITAVQRWPVHGEADRSLRHGHAVGPPPYGTWSSGSCSTRRYTAQHPLGRFCKFKLG
jgi:hypothetical protein